MSLHARIVGWVTFFAALAVLLVGLGDYVQAVRSLQATLEASVRTSVLQAAAETERQYDAQRVKLVAMAAVASMGSPESIDTGDAAQFSRLAIRSEGHTILELAPARGVAAAGDCGAALVDFDFVFSNPAGRAVQVIASMPARTFFSAIASEASRHGRRGITAVLRAKDGAVVRDVACGLEAAGPDLAASLSAEAAGPVPAGAPDLRLYRLEADGNEPLIAAMVEAPGPAWVFLVAAYRGDYIAPFLSARVKYLAFMVFIIVLAALLVLHGIRRDLARLSAIARAADEIGRGRFDVWLPPPTRDELGRVSFALGRMVDRLSASIKQLEITRSMAVVGELSTYLSHEIRNPLSSIRLNLQMLKRDLASGEAPDDAEQLVNLSLTELRRLDGVVRAVLELGRQGHGSSRGSCNVNATIQDTLRMMHRKLEEHRVEVELRLAPEELMAGMDGAALRGVLMNLVLNSIDAMAQATERRISVETDRVDTSVGPGVMVAVRDTGPGVPPHLRDRIFDPFFTTKAAGNGIGLSTSMRAIRECGGMLRYVPRAEAAGAEFILDLPFGADSGEAGPAADVAADGAVMDDPGNPQREPPLVAAGA